MTERNFWIASGYDLLEPQAGRLAVTPDFVRAYLGRPEMMPPADASTGERALHATLLKDPTRSVQPNELAGLGDADARENYEVFLRFRDLLFQSKTAEAAYLALFRPGAQVMPGLFIDHLAAVILRHVLDGCTDAERVRAAELFFRTQKAALEGGAILVADDETVETLGKSGGFGNLGRLVAEAGTAMRGVDLDVLTEANAAGYWARSDRHDMVLDFTFARAGQDAFARVVEAWVKHLLGVDVTVQPVQTIRDERWVWHVGLDAEASRLMNDLYEGRAVAEDRLRQILALFRLEFRDPDAMLPRVAGRPVYLGLAMDSGGRVRMKPQNLVVNLPLRGKEP
jgi:Family of unknown function (DUF6352)